MCVVVHLPLGSHLELQRLNTELQDLESNYVEVQAVVFKRLCDKVL